MTNEKGQSTSALFGFIRSVQKLIRDFSPHHLVCVFDGPDNKKPRQEIFADYKSHRKGAPEDLFPQFELAYDYCKMAGIPVIQVNGVEADDSMATIALWGEKQGAQAFLCSSDKDLMQLVNDRIFVLQLHKNNLIIGKEKVKEIYGVNPNQILDYLAIMGDASDNIPGLEGFGPKTASTLLQEFGTLDYILEHPEKIKGEKKQAILKSQKEIALMSRALATLHTNVDVPLEKDFYLLKQQNTEALTQFFTEMKFNTLLKELHSAPTPTETNQNEISKAALHPLSIDYRLVDSEEDLKALFDSLSSAKEVGIQLLATDPQPLLAHLVGIAFSSEGGKAWYLPLNGSLGKKRITEALRHFFENTKCLFFGHELKYQYHILKNMGIDLRGKISFDTLLAAYLIEPQTRHHSLDILMLEKFQKGKTPLETLIGKGKKQIPIRDVPLDQIKDYCCESVDYTGRLKEIFQPEITKLNLDKLLYEIELPLLPILAEMERVGISIDLEELKKEKSKVIEELTRAKLKIFGIIGEEFNLNSPKQLSEILYDKMGIPSKTKSTSAEILEELSTDYPVAKDILEYRGLEKLRSTYIDALPMTVNPITGKIHCTFNQSVTATGRLSSQDPNLQNIPLHSGIRACFKPKEGFSFIGADYSQIELRLLAHFSKDPELSSAFKNGRDIHIHTASLVFNVREDQVTDVMRSQAKTVNFGIVYGQSAFGLSKQLGISPKEASLFIKTYFERYPGVLEYLEKAKEEVKRTGSSKTLTGRLRPIGEIHNKNPMIRAAAERLAINTPLQGTAADLIKLAMIEIEKEIKELSLKGKMILQIHDELIFEIPDSEIPTFKDLVKEKMEQVIKLDVPIEVHIAVGKNWAEC